MIITKSISSHQLNIEDEIVSSQDFLEPMVSFDSLLAYYYYNVYHSRSIRLKAKLLSNTIDTDISKYLRVTQKQFLYSFCLDLEIYGNAFCERAGSASNFYLYNLLGRYGRIDKCYNVYQYIQNENKSVKLEGHHLKYTSPRAIYYGEPDYLSVLNQISITNKADKYNDLYFDNGARPEMAIIFEGATPTPEQKKGFKQFFGDNFRGLEHTHKTLIMWAEAQNEKIPNIKIENISQVDDMSFEKLKNVNRDEIVASHGVPPRLVGVVSSTQLSNNN